MASASCLHKAGVSVQVTQEGTWPAPAPPPPSCCPGTPSSANKAFLSGRASQQ